ncbi:N-acetylmuramoyl-L-alanine amidase [Kiritimatiellaeota bacterium B1221]|nr:N-acetylmuramoyl-L-alanine amidase [Kiritimatiellaeota bacterium B1221]
MHLSFRFFPAGLLLVLAFFLVGSARPPHGETTPPSIQSPKRVTIKAFARTYGFTDIKVSDEQVRLKGRVHEIVFSKHSRRAELNGTVVWLNDAMVVEDRQWVLSQTDVQLTLKPLLVPTELLKEQGYQVVVLDAGHGGEDGGAVSPTGLLEKQVVLDITHRVRALLMAEGYTVYVTRHDDRFLELAERPRRAEKWNANVFVSIHANSGGASAMGTESFALALPGYRSTNQAAGSLIPKDSYPGNAFNQANMSLTYAIHHALVHQNQLTDRGLRRARFAVLKNAPCPAALVEVGFLSHAQEGAKLAKAETRAALALSIATGIDNYLRTVKKAVISPDTVE